MTLPIHAVSHHQLSPQNSPKTVYSYPTLKPPSFYRNMAPIHDEVLHLQTQWCWYSSTMKFYVVHKLWHKITKLRSQIGTAGTCTGADFNQMVSWLSWGMGNIFLELTITLKTKKLCFSIFFLKVCLSVVFVFSHIKWKMIIQVKQCAFLSLHSSMFKTRLDSLPNIVKICLVTTWNWRNLSLLNWTSDPYFYRIWLC